MKVEIIKGPHTDEAIQKCYEYILEVYRKELSKENRSNNN